MFSTAMFRKFSVALLLLLVTAAAGWTQEAAEVEPLSVTDLAPLAKSLLFPGTAAVDVQALVPAGPIEKSLRAELNLSVELLTLENGQKEVQASLTPRSGATEEFEIRPDLASGTYTAAVRPADGSEFDKYEWPESPRRELGELRSKIFDGAFCREVRIISRDHTGSAGVIRATTTASLHWRWFSGGSITCMQIVSKSRSCNPAFGMAAASCQEITTNNGKDRASQTVYGSYNGTPPGSPTLSILNTTAINAFTFTGSFTSASLVSPASENPLLIILVDDFPYQCEPPLHV